MQLRSVAHHLRLQRGSSSVKCKAAAKDKSADEKINAIELAEEGPSTDVAVIWGRLVKVSSACPDIEAGCYYMRMANKFKIIR
jgi:hypothetical protein